ncbi:MAG: hypothetical protein QW265_03010 [Candidatus Bathyarchaeia archaeon]
MSPKIFFVGITIIVIGLLLFVFGTQTSIAYDVKIDKGNLIEPVYFSVKDVYFIERSLQKNTTITCLGKVEILETDDQNDINFYILEEENFKKWKAREDDVNYKLRLLRVKDFNTSLIVDKDGVYFFIFDNSYSFLKKEVNFQVIYQREVLIPKESKSYELNNLGIGLAILGSVLTIYGIIKKEPIPWS